MDEQSRKFELERRLAAWSDASQREVAEFVGGYRDLLARRITNAQLAGLHNVVQAASSFQRIKQFIDHQGSKAIRAGRDDVASYWTAMSKTLENLRRPAEQMWTEVPGGPPFGTPLARQVLDLWHCRLVQEYVQHLIAHSQWSRPASSRDQSR